MPRSRDPRADLPDESLEDDRSWQGDHDPYLARLAHEGRRQRPPAPLKGPRIEGPADDGDPYLALLAATRRSTPDQE